MEVVVNRFSLFCFFCLSLGVKCQHGRMTDDENSTGYMPYETYLYLSRDLSLLLLLSLWALDTRVLLGI